MSVDDRAVVDVESDSLGNGDPLAMSAKANEVVWRVEMVHAVDFLLDNGTGIEVGGDVVAGGADEFHAPLVGLFVRVRPDEGGQETVVDVDDPPGEIAAKIVGDDLHEAGENDQFDVLLLDHAPDFRKAALAIFPVHVDLVKRNIGSFRDGTAVAAVSDDRRDFDRELVEFGAPENFVEAMVGFGDQDGGPHSVGEAPEVPVGVQRAAKGPKSVDEILWIDVQIGGFNFEPGEKFPRELVGELGELYQVSAMSCHIIGDFGDDTRLIMATEFED